MVTAGQLSSPAEVYCHLRQQQTTALSYELFEIALQNSICFSAYRGAEPVGFARVISDCATFAYLTELTAFQLEFQEEIISKIIAAVLADARLQQLRRLLLVSSAGKIAELFDFKKLQYPERLMHCAHPVVGSYANKPAIAIATSVSAANQEVVYNYLRCQSHWAKGLPYDIFVRSLANSLCFSACLAGDVQIGFARVISDYSSLAYLADVFVLPPYRGIGVCSLLMQAVFSQPCLAAVEQFLLVSSYAQDFYSRYGFSRLRDLENFWERYDSSGYVYK